MIKLLLRIHNIIHNTRVEGPGCRTCIFTQGCLKHCKGCNSPQTWSLNDGYSVDINILAGNILSDKKIEGITFSGGEPFLQARNLYKLALILKEHNLSIVTFTGYSYKFIREVNDANWNNLLSVTDLLIAGAYEENNACYDRAWIGSGNQKYIFLTDRYRYLENNMNSIKNRVEIRLNKDGSIIVNGMADNKKIKDLFNKITEEHD